MSRRIDRDDPDRYLAQRGGYFTYKRRVALKLIELEQRAPIVRGALGTRDIGEARVKRDSYERADDELWGELLAQSDADVAHARHRAAMARTEALGFTYRHIPAMLKEESAATIMERLRKLNALKAGSREASAVIGDIPPPSVSVTKAFEIYCNEIAADELIRKSQPQKDAWKKVKKRAVENFKSVAGNKNIDEINRDDAKALYNYWRARIAPEKGKPTHTASSGNRDLGNMRLLYEKYFKYLGIEIDKNPFNDLGFAELKKRTRPPFPLEWIKTMIIAPGKLASMNDEARGVILALIETGARPSEICNLGAGNIQLEHAVPHIIIEPRDDPDDPREIKTHSSVRQVPIVGMALEVFKKHPNGFPRYKDKEANMSGTLNKFFRENGLFPSTKHKIYSFRHSFEDRMKVGGFDTELRMILMGHAIDRASYGVGGTLEWKRDAMLKIALPFDAGIV